MVNHSVDYTIAAVCSWGEFFLELFFSPPLKAEWYSFVIGLTLVAIGQSCRIIAMHTAKSNFSHVIMEKKEASHRLVTHGIYGYEVLILLWGLNGVR